MQNRRYIASGTIISLTTLFVVPKEDSDIRLVYDLTVFGLNEALWDSKFLMPSIDYFLDTATHSSWCDDVDAAKMFHNYKRSDKAQPYAGVDNYWTKKEKAMRW